MYYKAESYITDENYLLTYNVFEMGDIAFEGNKSKNFAHGRFVENTIGNGIVSHVFDVFKPRMTNYDLQFWKYAINNERIMGPILLRSTKASTMMTNLVADDFLQENFLIPCYEEQKKIGEFLNQLDTLITLHQRKLEKLVQIRKAFAERCFLQSRKEFVMAFTKEADFEEAVVKLLIERGWKDGVLKNYTEQQLIQNWANILFENNRGIDRLNDYPLTDGEMQQIMEQVTNAKTPMKLNKFINGKSVLIKRDNPDDKLNFGKEVSLKIYDRLEIAAGLSRYQIAEQPKFPTKSKILNDRRGDLMLLINGMPVIHMELKKSGVSIIKACNQIEKYAAEGIFTGLFSLVQIFVAMNPEETVYFANPGPEGQFNPSYYFHWADFYNEPMND